MVKIHAVFHLVLNGVYWGYNPLTNLLLTSWHILVDVDWNPLKSHMGPWSADAIHRRLLFETQVRVLFTDCIEGPNMFGEIVLGKYVQFLNKTRSKDLWIELTLFVKHRLQLTCPSINIELDYSRDTVSRQIHFQKLKINEFWPTGMSMEVIVTIVIVSWLMTHLFKRDVFTTYGPIGGEIMNQQDIPSMESQVASPCFGNSLFWPCTTHQWILWNIQVWLRENTSFMFISLISFLNLAIQFDQCLEPHNSWTSNK